MNRSLTQLLTPALVFVCGALVTDSATSQGYPPQIAAERMSVADGLTVKLFASEPQVRQPILVKVDDRGRLWTIQYLQYPNPAGLKRVKVDRWSRTSYDRVPDPPPRGPRGADRITILEDTDRDGVADKFTDFVDGLNLATGVAFGHGGIYVLQVPYLLFYPDRNRDDVPDTEPRVLLKGFGMEDAQSMANHLTWGPDGWLYGVNGSTTTCRIRGVEFQQGVWRYDPLTDRFELFCEGGGNTYGLTFDEHGNLFYSTNGGPFVHALQGAYYYKSFGKHGPLHNPYAYGYFPHVERDAVPGGPPTGGTIYLGDSFPDLYRGKFIAGNFLGHTVSWWDVQPQQTTFRAHYGDVLLGAQDTWFGATDVCLGPSGALFVCDFHDRRTSHPDPDANWDRSNGRIYTIQAHGRSPARTLNLHEMSSTALVELLMHRNRWYADRARVELAARRDPAILRQLSEMAADQVNPSRALQGLWALHVSGGFEQEIALRLLAHPDPHVRGWTVRLLADAQQVSPEISRRLTALAKTEPNQIVRAQLAASAKRLPPDDGLPIVTAILARDLDVDDPRIGWLLWWSIEDKAVSAKQSLLDYFARTQAWDNPSNHDNLRRLLRRWAAEGTATSYQACLSLLETTPPGQLASMHAALAQGLSERAAELPEIGQGGLFEQFATVDRSATQTLRHYEPPTRQLRDYLQRVWQEQADEPVRLELALRCDLDQAYAHTLSLLKPSAPQGARQAALELLIEFGQPNCVPYVLELLAGDEAAEIQSIALRLLGRFDEPHITSRILQSYASLATPAQDTARDVLLSRPQSALNLIQLVEQGRMASSEIPVAQLRHVSHYDNPQLAALILRHWGAVKPGTPEEKLATMRRFNNDLRTGSGDPGRGKPLFHKHCANCHRLFGDGNQVGPELTTANRAARDALLANLVDPSAVIRREYLSFVVQTTSGQVLTGLLGEQDAASITIVDAKNQRTKIRRTEIESLRESPVSLMPEKLLDALTPQELRDLFSYLQSPGNS